MRRIVNRWGPLVLNGGLPVQHLEAHLGQGVLVDPRVPTAGQLLGRHVFRRADDDARDGQFLFTRTIEGPGDAKVRHQRRPVFRQQNVLRLDVPVNDEVFVRMRQRLRGLERDADRLLDRQGPAAAEVDRGGSRRVHPAS